MGVLDRIPELACPACKGDLVETGAAVHCPTCDVRYDVRGGIPQMLSGEANQLAEEVAVQDRAAVEYEARRYENPYAARYHAWWTEQMLSCVRTDGRMLDNGCGVGVLFERLGPERVVGLDMSGEMLRRASTRSDRLVLGNSQDMPLKSASFDVVFCRSLLHHLPQPQLCVREMHRVLRDGGQIVLVDTNTSLLSALPRRIAYGGRRFAGAHRNMNRRSLEGLLRPYFSVDRVSYFGYFAYPLVGFPDLLGIFRYFPLKSFTTSALMRLDRGISRVPLLRTQSWAILIKGTRLQGSSRAPAAAQHCRSLTSSPRCE